MPKSGAKAEGTNQMDVSGLRETQLYLLREFLRVCGELSLPYFAVGGTALGAVRHGGYIPWDDDIDVGMPRSAYRVFLDKAPALLAADVFLQTFETDPGYPGCFAKLRRHGTLLLEETTSHLPMHQGVYIDLFPLDGCPVGFHKRVFDWKNDFYTRKCNTAYRFAGASFSFLGGLYNKLALLLQPSLQKAVRRRSALYERLPFESSPVAGNLTGAWRDRERMPRAVFGKGKLLPFEGIPLRVPENTHEYLSRLYGDYKTLPPEEKRVSHHGVIKAEVPVKGEGEQTREKA